MYSWKFGRTRKSCGAAHAPTAFLVLPNFHSYLYNSFTLALDIRYCWVKSKANNLFLKDCYLSKNGALCDLADFCYGCHLRVLPSKKCGSSLTAHLYLSRSAWRVSWTFFTFHGVTQLWISSSDTRPVLSTTGECGTTGDNDTGLSTTGEWGTAEDNGAGLIGNTSRWRSVKAHQLYSDQLPWRPNWQWWRLSWIDSCWNWHLNWPIKIKESNLKNDKTRRLFIP